MPDKIKVGFRWILRAKTPEEAQTAVDLLKRFQGEVTHVRRAGEEVRWTTDGESPAMVTSLRRGVAGQLERRRRSAYAVPRIVLPAPKAEELTRLREAAHRDGILAEGDAGADDVLAQLVERCWVEPVPGQPREYRLTALGRRWAA
jgi:hypothetical protein